MTTLKEENRKLQEQLKNTQKSLRESQKRQKSAERERDVALKRIQNITKSKDKDKDAINTLNKKVVYHQTQVQALVAFDNNYSLRGTEHDKMWDNVVELDRIIDDPKLLKSITGRTPEQFELILECFEVFSLRGGNMPLFRGNVNRAKDPGNRCKLYPRHALLLMLCRQYTGLTEAALQVRFGVEQSTVSRYITLGGEILPHILPTADFMTDRLQNAESLDEIREILPDLHILIDGTHIPRQRPGDKGERKQAYSGKKKRFSFNIQVITNYMGLILNMSDAVNGSTHDYTLFKNHLAGLGAWLLQLAILLKKFGKKLYVVVDLGYLGIIKDYNEFNVMQGTKRLRKTHPDYEPKNGGLTDKQIQHNKAVSKKRIPVEWAIGRLKAYRLLRGPYIGTACDVRRDANIISGLANLNMLWDHTNKRPSKLLQKLYAEIQSRLASIIS